jgi:hypothetical protein
LGAHNGANQEPVTKVLVCVVAHVYRMFRCPYRGVKVASGRHVPMVDRDEPFLPCETPSDASLLKKLRKPSPQGRVFGVGGTCGDVSRGIKVDRFFHDAGSEFDAAVALGRPSFASGRRTARRYGRQANAEEVDETGWMSDICSRNLCASRAAMHPLPAEVIAWR